MGFSARSDARLVLKTARRGYDAAKITRLNSDWTTTSRSSNEEIRYDLKKLRARCRQLAMNDDYVKNFLRKLKTNVVGPQGIRLQNKAKDPGGTLDKGANDQIEEMWREWGKKGTASVCGRLSWWDIQNLVLESAARDGEILVREVRGFDNKFRYALQLIEADHLDLDYNKELLNGNSIRMGVEVDRWKRAVAYHVLTKHPGDFTTARLTTRRERIPANEILHPYVIERVDQLRGVPWMHTAMARLNMLGGYEEAEIVGARVSASKMGFFYNEEGNAAYGGDTTEAGDVLTEAEPGTFEQLPPGLKFQAYDPQHPNSAYKDFIKGVLRGASAGLGISYNTLASDLEGVNYSSIRQGVMDDRDVWRCLQMWQVGNLHAPVYSSWLSMSLLSGAIKLPNSKFDKFNKANWRPRGWGWVDPLKDQKTASEAVAKGFKSRTSIMAEQGLDIEDVFEQLHHEKELADKYGLDFDVQKIKGGVNGTTGKQAN